MSSGKMNTITDPLAAQKTQAANIGLGNYQTASSNVPALQGVANNLGQSQGQTLNTENPLFQGVYNDVNQDINGSGGPYSALTQNLLGSFDTQQTNTQNQLQQQLQASGLLGSGAGMAVLGQQGTQAAQARAGLVDQNQVNMLNMGDQLAQQLSAQNQQQGYANPMAALGQIQSLSTPPNFQSPDNTYYTPAQSPVPGILGSVAGTALGAAMGNPMGVASGLAGLLGQTAGSTGTSMIPTAMSSGAYSPAGNFYNPANVLNNGVSLSAPYQQQYYNT